MNLFSPDAQIPSQNLVLGGLLRVTQLRVKPEACDVPQLPMFLYFTEELGFAFHSAPCYPRWSSAAEDTEERSPITRCAAEYVAMLAPNLTSQINDTEKWLPKLYNKSITGWEHWPSPTGKEYTVPGYFGRYPVGQGYTFLLYSTIERGVKAYLDCLEQNDWIDSQTRFVSLQFVTYRPGTAIWTWHTYFLEFLPTGVPSSLRSFGIGAGQRTGGAGSRVSAVIAPDAWPGGTEFQSRMGHK